jgi:aspartate/methionine/tyrosine aminotransferase
MSTQQPRNLTEFELMAQVSHLDLADGHANHSLSPRTLSALEDAFAASLKEPRHGQVQRVEQDFLQALTRHTRQNYPVDSSHIVYSASVGVDIVAKYLAGNRRRTGMITPIFDNLPALVAMAGVELIPVPERLVMPAPDFEELNSKRLGALFLVLPNNPTGVGMDFGAVRRLLEWGADRGVLIIFDTSFRLLSPEVCVDLIAMAEEVGADAVTVDDTGKTVALQDTKVSVLSVTHRLRDRISEVVSHCLLNVSCLDLRLLTRILTMPPEGDEVARARSLARANRTVLREMLTHAGLASSLPRSAPARASAISVEWLHVGPEQEQVLRGCRAAGLEVLPGQPFFWSRGGDETPQVSEWVRMALLRDAEEFRRGAEIFVSALRTRA